MNHLTKTVKNLLGAMLFLLPWQTIWITKENFINSAKWQYGTLGFYATEIILWLTILVFIIWYWQEKKTRGRDFKFNFSTDRLFLFSIFLFVAYCLSSVAWAINSTIAFQHARHIMEAIILFLMLFIGPINFRESVSWLTSGAVLQSLLGMFQFFTQQTFDFKWLGLTSHSAYEAGASIVANIDIGRWLRAYGSFSHPNILGGYLAVVLIVMITEISKLQKISLYYYLSVMLLFTGLFFTFSRSAWLGFIIFIIGLLVVSLINKDKNVLYLIFYLFILGAALSFIYQPLLQTRIYAISANETKSTAERLSGYREAWQIFQKNPLIGVGAGNYTAATHQLNPNLAGWNYQPVHNVFLLVLVELGLIGIFLAVSSLILYINSFKKQLMPRFYFLGLILAIFLLFDHYFFSSYVGLLIFATAFGLICRPKHTESAL